MANLDVQPKKRGFGWLWLLLLILLVGGIYFFMHNRNQNVAATEPPTIAATTTENGKVSSAWDSVDMDAPTANYEEITDTNVTANATERYAVYSLGENILFDEGKSAIRKEAEAGLQQIANSLKKRYSDGEIQIFGFTDAAGGTGANKQLSQERAEAVKIWLTNKAGIREAMVSIHAMGENKPVETNATTEGRQQNRRVEIVAMTTK